MQRHSKKVPQTRESKVFETFLKIHTLRNEKASHVNLLGIAAHPFWRLPPPWHDIHYNNDFSRAGMTTDFILSNFGLEPILLNWTNDQVRQWLNLTLSTCNGSHSTHQNSASSLSWMTRRTWLWASIPVKMPNMTTLFRNDLDDLMEDDSHPLSSR